MSIPGYLKNFVGGFNSDKFVIPTEELKILTYLKHMTSTDSVILMLPEKNDNSPAYVSAVSERRVFLGDSVQVELTNLNYKQRYNELLSVINDDDSHVEQFLKNNNISYLYLTARNYNILIDTTFMSKFKPIIINDRVALFKYN